MVTIAQCLKEMGNFPDLGMSWSGIGEETYTVRAIIPGNAGDIASQGNADP